MRMLFFIIVLGIIVNLNAQTPISRPEIFWALGHPFVALKAKRISADALNKAKAVEKSGIIKDNIGGQYDAFKHAFWMAVLSQEIGKRKTLKLGKAHEKGNYLQFKKMKKEDGMLSDKALSDMDLQNNIVGAAIADRKNKKTVEELTAILIQKVKNGELVILLKDCDGYFIDCNRNIINKENLVFEWESERCIVPSNDIENCNN